MALVEIENVSKVFRARRGPKTLLAGGGVINLLRRQPKEYVTALENVSFTVDPGETVGIIGANGSGKSTLLKILAGVTAPSDGVVRIHGRVASLLELGAGFHHLLTGRENVYLNGRILGMSRADVDRSFDDIAAFSGIGDFIDQPVGTYSSGMFVRLGFAVAVHANPDLFLVDEVLSVGDEEFQRKCRVRIGELREQGKTILFVSHDLGTVNTLCSRVILLSRGQMIVRNNPQDTIDYYLRQVGRSKGIHTLASGPVEVVFSNGRMALFRDKAEATAPNGVHVVLQYMGQFHYSYTAEWEVVTGDDEQFVARGRMARLPVTLEWRARIDKGLIHWELAIDCERPLPLETFDANIPMPAAYTQWTYGELTGHFPEIRPSDMVWSEVLSPDLRTREAAATAEEGSSLPCAHVALETDRSYVRMQWSNSDYVSSCRVLQAGARLPESARPLSEGRHELESITIDLSATEASIAARRAGLAGQRRIVSGSVEAQFDSGMVRFCHDGKQVTEFVQFYASLLIGGLWNDSQNLDWGTVERDGDTLRAAGESRRFPFVQHWTLKPAEGGVSVRIELEARSAFDVSEYQTSMALKADYDRWQTAAEQGAFPPFDPNQHDWRHANQQYPPGTRIKALSKNLPSVTLEATVADPVFRMTAINTGFHQQARVLQALHVPDAGLLRFEPGRHLYFEGVVLISN